MMYREQLFNKWKFRCDELKELSCVIQNDFTQMKLDGYITNNDIIQAKNDFVQQFENKKLQLESLKDEIIKLLESEISK